ncbi:MAG TPA: hypothetical protein VFP86_11425 [bacterium]|jgi:hypothetical protein|nr:hypothetical protein [bacterium]
MPEPQFTRADLYRTATSALMVALGLVILARTVGFGLHPMSLLVGFGFIGLGAYRLSFVVAYLRRRGSA